MRDKSFLSQIYAKKHKSENEEKSLPNSILKISFGKVIAFGPGIESGTPINGERVSFKLDTSNAGGSAPVAVIAIADGEVVPVDVEQVESGLYELSYTPRKAAKHTIIPTYDDVAVQGSPFRVTIDLKCLRRIYILLLMY